VPTSQNFASMKTRLPEPILWVCVGAGVWLIVLGIHRFSDYYVYQLSRWGVCVAAVIIGWRFHIGRRLVAPPVCALLAVIYNPLRPISFGDAWPVVNWLSASALLLIAGRDIIQMAWMQKLDGGIRRKRRRTLGKRAVLMILLVGLVITFITWSAARRKAPEASHAENARHLPESENVRSQEWLKPQAVENEVHPVIQGQSAQTNSFGWTVVTLNGVAYVPVADVAAFYHLSLTKADGDKEGPPPRAIFVLASSKFRLEIKPGSNDVIMVLPRNLWAVLDE
jgi:hypothetical protein